MHKRQFRTLIICPAHLVPNWTRQIKSFTNAPFIVMQGKEPTKFDYLSLLAVDQQKEFTVINYHSLRHVVEYKEIKQDKEGYSHEKHNERFMWVELINLAKFDFIIIDEAHYAKNTDSSQSKACRQLTGGKVIFLTATPVMNRPGEFWPLLNMAKPDMFDSEERFVRQYTYDGKVARNVQELHAVTKTLMIRRLKKDVQKDLKEVERINRYHKLSDKARKIYQRLLDGIEERITGNGEIKQQAITSILTQIMRCKQVAAIDKMDATAMLATELYDGSEGDTHRKVLIFTQFVPIVKGLKNRLAEGGECLYITGAEHTVEDRMRIVQEFTNNDKVHYLVCSIKAASEGLDITAAGHVIFHDLMWTPAAHDQAEGRAYGRLNDEHSIDSYFMIAEETIEEDIMELLYKKQDMINSVVEGMNSSRNDSIAMELIKRIKSGMYTKGAR